MEEQIPASRKFFIGKGLDESSNQRSLDRLYSMLDIVVLLDGLLAWHLYRRTPLCRTLVSPPPLLGC